MFKYLYLILLLVVISSCATLSTTVHKSYDLISGDSTCIVMPHSGFYGTDLGFKKIKRCEKNRENVYLLIQSSVSSGLSLERKTDLKILFGNDSIVSFNNLIVKLLKKLCSQKICLFLNNSGN